MAIVLHVVFLLLALLVIYSVLIVPLYNFFTRPVKAMRDITVAFFSVIFTGVILQILWSIHGDLLRWLG